MSHFNFESFKKAEFRTYFPCSHKFSQKMKISKNSLRGLVVSVYWSSWALARAWQAQKGRGGRNVLSPQSPCPGAHLMGSCPPFFPSSLSSDWLLLLLFLFFFKVIVLLSSFSKLQLCWREWDSLCGVPPSCAFFSLFRSLPPFVGLLMQNINGTPFFWL